MLHCTIDIDAPAPTGRQARGPTQGPHMAVDTTVTLDRAPPGAAIHSLFTRSRATAAPVRRVALIGTFVPRKCGIATFTNDVFEKLGQFHPGIQVDVYALENLDSPL